MPDQASFIVGNNYKRISNQDAKRSRSGILKNHDVEIFLDIINGNPDLIHQVTFHLGSSFEPEQFTCSTPVQKTITSHGIQVKVWRFSTRQQVFGSFQTNIKIRGAGGSSGQSIHDVSFHRNSERDAHSQPPSIFRESRFSKNFKMNRFPDNAKFGIELELTSSNHLDSNYISKQLQLKNGRIGVDVIENYREGRRTTSNWKIVSDSSIVCSTTQPDCNKFELVSPPLTGGDGLQNVAIILQRMGNISPRLKVNKSMGFHVHVDVSTFSFAQIVKICQQFVKYEQVLDSFMPLSRRTGSTESKKFFQSSRQSIKDQYYYGAREKMTNRRMLEALDECEDMDALVLLMNRTGRYYKFNLQNLASGRQTTIEFRQHSATMSYEKVGSWVRLCVAFCMNSAKLRAPSAFKDGSSMEKMFQGLFQFVIKDRALRDFYSQRQLALTNGGDDDDCGCCADCNDGGGGCNSLKRGRSYS
jgi:hypothetical protein